jgi:small nuclear ribonucleoprotein
LGINKIVGKLKTNWQNIYIELTVIFTDILLGVITMDESLRPLDTLNAARNKTVMVDLKNGLRYVGKLRAFDIHINTVLEDAEEHQNGEIKRKLGTVFIRGDTITILSPA